MPVDQEVQFTYKGLAGEFGLAREFIAARSRAGMTRVR
jgi:hypothetical protein